MKKVVLIGAADSGKTSLVERLVHNTFKPGEATIGAAFSTLSIKDGEKIGIWDTAGQERYDALVPLYFRDAALVLIVVDITSRFSLDGAKKWVEYLRIHHSNLPSMIVGTKIDLFEKRTVYTSDLELLGDQIVPSVQVSSKDSVNIDILISRLEDALSREMNTPPSSPLYSLTKTNRCCMY